MGSIKIFLPVFPKIVENIYFNGYVNNSYKGNIVIFITNFSTTDSKIITQISKPNSVFGYCTNAKLVENINIVTNCANRITIQDSETFRISELILDNKNITNNNIIVMLYDIDKVLNSETFNVCCNDFEQLQMYLLTDNNKSRTTEEYVPLQTAPHWISSSMFIQHCFNQINLLNWIKNTVKRKEKVSLKQGNFIVALVIDIILGYLILELFLFDRSKIGILLLGILEKLVNYMYSLLKWLMGVPAGLKLNNAFNKMLGNYFSYHVELWWLFLDVSGEKVDFILQIIQYLGYLGITFQAALISDMICIATFHSYCIYVYAARLFNIQISGLIALLRLFVGRKYNPLRDCIDSCEYSNQELFVGTVAFTILLLLLPTTIMYYIVFTLFRVLSLFVQYTLSRLINIIQTLPLYVITLWVIRSPKLAGNILIEVAENTSKEHLILRVKLLNKPLGEIICFSKPPVEHPKNVEWKNIVSNVFTGKQII